MTNENLVNLCASATSGFISRVICHPIDTCKAKLQSIDSFKGTFDVARKTIQSEGVKGLYKGINAALFGGIPGVCLYITTYEACKTYCASHEILKQYPMMSYFGGGMIAETVCCAVFVPVDVIKERLQVQSNRHTSTQYKGGVDAFRTILRQEGLTGLYKGYGATLFSYGPFSAIYFVLYEESKKLARLSRRQAVSSGASTSPSTSPVDQLSFSENLVCSATAGSVASFVTNPLDMAKLRYQIQRSDIRTTIQSSEKEVVYSGLFDAMSKIRASHGVRGLFRGAGTRVLFHTPATAITMSVYEECKKGFSEWL